MSKFFIYAAPAALGVLLDILGYSFMTWQFYAVFAVAIAWVFACVGEALK